MKGLVYFSWNMAINVIANNIYCYILLPFTFIHLKNCLEKIKGQNSDRFGECEHLCPA